MKVPFSQRYGYIKPEHILIREDLSGYILNSVMNCLTDLYNIRQFPYDLYKELNRTFHNQYLNLRYNEDGPSILEYIENTNNLWYNRIDVMEWLISIHREQCDDESNTMRSSRLHSIIDDFIESLNSEFERLNYGYRIIDDIFIETTSSTELAVIQESLDNADANSVTHLQECLKLLSPSNQELSTRNAIKEAISAVEVTARKITNTNTLDEAFKKLREIHPMIRLSMEKLYHYTNQKDTGIRHGWMEQSDEPTINEAIFVLVTSCSFLNYLSKIYNAPTTL